MAKKITIKIDAYDEYRVPAPDGEERGAYYTNDKDDARGTAALMYHRKIKIAFRRVAEF